MREMDLHDFEDVAENYDNYLSVISEVEGSFNGFQEFYLELARKYGQNGIIDIACGTGAVLLYLAERGMDVDGTDLSAAMVHVARQKATKLGLELAIFEANMTEFRSNRKYSLAIIARSGFLHLTTPELQRKALLNIRENLLPGGILTLNTFAPNVRIQYEQVNTSPEDYKFRLEYTNIHNETERLYNAITYDCNTQIMYGNWKFETLDKDRNIINTRIRPVKMRQTYKMEMMYLIELCGFEIIDIYSDYHKSPDTNDNFIWVLRRKE
jgi:2-polyprenyl-3-methyl-5-hydroxy-6-metoxy-1,4-benzoquinol methylase